VQPTLSDEERAVEGEEEESTTAERLRAAASETAGAITADRKDFATDHACMNVMVRTANWCKQNLGTVRKERKKGDENQPRESVTVNKHATRG